MSIELASLKGEEEGEKLIFDRVRFRRKMAVLEGAAMHTVSSPHVDKEW